MSDKNIVTIHRVINVNNLKNYFNIIPGDSTIKKLLEEYDKDNIVNVLNAYFDKYDGYFINYEMFVNFITKLDMIILKDSEFMLYDIVSIKTINMISDVEFKVEYKYRRIHGYL